MALCQVPFTWLATNPSNGPWAPPSTLISYDPPALQLPAEAQDTELTLALPIVFSATLPGTSENLPHLPWTSLITIAWRLPPLSVNQPPALQLPAEAQDSELIPAPAPAKLKVMPTITDSLPQVPPAWLIMNRRVVSWTSV